MPSYRQFRAFLKDQGCEVAFDQAFFAYNGCTVLDERLWETGDAEYIFAHAFDWQATPEGRDFWVEIDREWYNLMRFGHSS